MNIDTRVVDGVTILDVHGKITIGDGSVEIRNKVRETLDQGNKKILLNLGDVSYVDSSGIGELVSSFTTVTNQGGELKEVGQLDQEIAGVIGYHQTIDRLRLLRRRE